MYNIPKFLYLNGPLNINLDNIFESDKTLYAYDEKEYIKYIQLLLISEIKIPNIIKNNDTLMAMFLGKPHFVDVNQFDFNGYFFAGRLGNTEIKIMRYYMTDDCKKINKFPYSKRAWQNAGIYPVTDYYLKIFADEYYNALKTTTHMSCSWNDLDESYFISECKNIFRYNLLDAKNWFSVLKNKKILIISPIVDYIQKQWDSNNIFKCHDNNTTMQNTDTGITLKYIKMPYSLAFNSPHNNWIETYDYVIEKINEINDFDIALVSAGGYGILLCNYIFSILNVIEIFELK